MPVIVTVRETAKEIADCAKKAMVVRGRSGALMRPILRESPGRHLSTDTHSLVS
jgi:hypothetical protein